MKIKQVRETPDEELDAQVKAAKREILEVVQAFLEEE